MFKRIALALCAAAVISVSAVLVNAQTSTSVDPLPAAPAYTASSAEQALADVYQSVSQSVVNINVVGSNQAGTGSGFVIDTDGHIVTNNHVVENADYIQVNFNDGTVLDAELVGRDPDSDLAVIRVDPKQADLQPVTFANSDDVFVGEGVMAIGSPFGEDFTLTTGIVSALDRSLDSEGNFSIPELIQTDAAINPGNSGGPLLNMQGQVIGVNTAILGGTRTSSGVGFSIPSNQVRRVVPYLIKDGNYKHSWLGIAGTTVQPEQRKEMNLDSDLQGVMVAQVTQGSPADKGNLQAATDAIRTPFGQQPINGDIITAINGTAITNMYDLIAYLNDHTQPGDSVKLSILRDGSTSEVEITLAERPTR